ncbi:MAG: nitroreductase family protein [Eubacterium sp.]
MTNSEYIKAIDMRRSRRTYRNKPLEPEVMDVIRQMVDAVNVESGLNFKFVEDGTPAFRIFGGKFSMIAVCGDNTQKARENCGYFGESIVLQCVYHGLGTCWVSGTYNENKVYQMVNIPNEQRLYAVITIGYVKDSLSLLEKTMYNATHKKNKPYQLMFSVCDEKLPEDIVYAMQLVEKAPSAVNRRPVDFKYEDGVVSGSVKEPYSDMSVDFGIAKLHFAIGMRRMGVIGSWNTENKFIITDAKAQEDNYE